MPTVGLEPIPKRQLIAATVASIHRNGFADTTVQTISRAAGVSPRIIDNYFGGMGALLAAAMRSLLVELRRFVVPALRAARGPRGRNEAVIDASFAERQFQPKVIVTWLAVCGQARHDPELARLQRIYARRLTGHLRHDLRPLVGFRAEIVATGLAAMIDGLWLGFALGRQNAGTATAREVARDYLARQLADCTHA